jgi:AraC family transcriptional activator FtrA
MMAWLTSDLSKSVAIAELATRIHLSERTLHRRFVVRTGINPIEWLTVERLHRARLLLEHSITTDLLSGSRKSSTMSIR